jgi:hypothetical protein
MTLDFPSPQLGCVLEDDRCRGRSGEQRGFATDNAMRSKPGPDSALAEPGPGLMEAAIKSDVIDQPTNGESPAGSRPRAARPALVFSDLYFCRCSRQ